MKIIIKNGIAVRIIIDPMPRKVYKLDEFLGGITSKNLHESVATGAPVGKEVW